MSAPRLSALGQVPPGVARPGYEPAAHGVGIVHLGLGAFHRTHGAVHTDDALAAEGGDWRIAGVSLRSAAVADALGPQNGLYTLLVRGPEGVSARVVGSLARAIAEPRRPGATLAAMTDPRVRIVSLTITEKAYGIERATGAVVPDHPAIGPDLARPRSPRGAAGLLVEALRLRREAGAEPFTVLSCDNLPENGALLRAGALDFAGRVDPGLRDWIAASVAFPSTMVDRITPAPSDETRAEARRITGLTDLAAVETEPFSQWVIEDRFPAGRPAWEAGGAVVVAEVAPFERMKLGMLNGAHSLIAYAGVLLGLRFVRDAMGDPAVAALVRRHLAAAAATLDPLPGVDLRDYAEALLARFANPAIAHETAQIAMDGTQKLPQRLFAPALVAIERGQDVRPFTFATAVWMRHAAGGGPLSDPREAEIRSAVGGSGRDARGIAKALQSLPGFVPERLRRDPAWSEPVERALLALLERGPAAAIAREAETLEDRAPPPPLAG